VREATEQPVLVPADDVGLEGVLVRPRATTRVVLFAHGSGSGRHSPRNNFVARVLHAAGLGTLLLDLLTEAEDADPRARFDLPLLTRRLLAATRWVEREVARDGPPALGLFGASTGAAAALFAAAAPGSPISAIVSRGGRPDLASEVVARVRAATLLIVGGYDTAVLQWNEEAHERLTCEKRLVVVPGATHLFPEPGALAQVARLAADWFTAHLRPVAGTPPGDAR